jgi:2,4-diaminopentanoate dehydrogenase
LVGVLAYSARKEGVDAGALFGIGEVGGKTTTDVSCFLATKPDCVFYAARDFTNFNTDPDILMLLEAGVNVITALPHHYPKIRGDDVAQKFDAAGKKGGATWLCCKNCCLY